MDTHIDTQSPLDPGVECMEAAAVSPISWLFFKVSHIIIWKPRRFLLRLLSRNGHVSCSSTGGKAAGSGGVRGRCLKDVQSPVFLSFFPFTRFTVSVVHHRCSLEIPGPAVKGQILSLSLLSNPPLPFFHHSFHMEHHSLPARVSPEALYPGSSKQHTAQ